VRTGLRQLEDGLPDGGERIPSAEYARHAAHSEVLPLREELMEGSPQPTRIVGPRPRHGGAMERARDRVLDGVRGQFYYRVTTVS
jgi:hypothetical protein